MRTKTLLLSAVLAAASAVTSMAQVYSVNMVGYINLTIPAGLSMIANHLNNSPNNQLASLFPPGATPLPNNSTVGKFNRISGGYDIDTYSDNNWENGGSLTLNPGEGCFLDSSGAFTFTSVGEVQLSSSVHIFPGLNIASSVIPQALPITQLGYVPNNGDTIGFFNRTSGGYDVYPYTDGAWESGEPVPAVGQSFFVDSAVDKNWTRTFPVGP